MTEHSDPHRESLPCSPIIKSGEEQIFHLLLPLLQENCLKGRLVVQVIVNFTFGLCVLTTYEVGRLSHGTHWGETCLTLSKLLQPGWYSGGLVLLFHYLLRVHHMR